ncbi:MAG: ATP-binding protein [Gammaproteobacteria bacterium]
MNAPAAETAPSPVGRQVGCLVRNRLLMPSLGIGFGLLASAALTTTLLLLPGQLALLAGLNLAVLIFTAVMTGLLLHRVDTGLVRHLRQIRQWAMRMHRGDLSARVPVPEVGDCAELARDINRLGEEFMLLSYDMENQVNKQTERLEENTRQLQLLYDVAAGVNMANDLDDLLTCFLHTLMEVVHADAGTVRLLTEGGRMRLVATIGFDEKEQDGADAAPEEVKDEDDDMEMLAIPLQYRGRTLGVYNLFGSRSVLKSRSEGRDEMLRSLGQHLGMAIQKNHLDRESTRLSLMEERGQIAHELHDSLAQTLASMRFQARLLDEAVGRGDRTGYNKQINTLKATLDEAYGELRELIAHFRAPLDRRGLLHALDKIVDRFQSQTGIQTFLQKSCEGVDLSAEAEMQVVRVIQESLANIRKHSKAHNVRVLLRCDPDAQNYHVLVEDDGVGFEMRPVEGSEGEHIGLSIMEQRARRVGGTLRIESEPGEGTRVVLDFPRGDRQASLLAGN